MRRHRAKLLWAVMLLIPVLVVVGYWFFPKTVTRCEKMNPTVCRTCVCPRGIPLGPRKPPHMIETEIRCLGSEPVGCSP